MMKKMCYNSFHEEKQMIDVEILKKEIVERLAPLEPDKIILFGSYAYGKPSEESDIDLFLLKDISVEEMRNFRFVAKKALRDFQFKYKIGVDLFVDSKERVEYRIKEVKDQFYQEIVQNGVVLYGK